MQIPLTATTDKIQLITGSAGDVDVMVGYMDASQATPPVVTNPNRQLTTITTAATTDICAAPGASTTRGVKNIHIRNAHASVSNQVTVLYNANASLYELHSVVLAPGEALEFVEGVGFYTLRASQITAIAPISGSSNYNLTATAGGFAADTYVSGSSVKLDAYGAPVVGRRYNFRLLISKTAAGTATPIITVRLGTAGTTADTAIHTLTWGAGTAAIDRGEIELEVMFRAVGAGTSAVSVAKANWTTNLQTTGLTSTIKALFNVSSGYDSTSPASRNLGLSYNGGTSAVHTIEWVTAWTDQL